MPKKVETYQSENDGKFHATEIACVRHEVLAALWEGVPELRDRKLLVEANIDKIARILHPLGSHIPEPEGTHAEGPIDHGELAGTCDCSAGMNGANDHARSCPSFKAVVHCRYAHPPGTRCPACSEVPPGVTVIPATEARQRA